MLICIPCSIKNTATSLAWAIALIGLTPRRLLRLKVRHPWLRNVVAAINGQVGKAAYDGDASCPLVTGYGKLVLAEFDYNMLPKETFPFDQGRERRSMYYLKKYALTKFYWDALLKGGI